MKISSSSADLQVSLFDWLAGDELVEQIELEQSQFFALPRDKSRRVRVTVTAFALESCFGELSSQSRAFWPDLSEVESAWCLLVENLDEALSTNAWSAGAVELAPTGEFVVVD